MWGSPSINCLETTFGSFHTCCERGCGKDSAKDNWCGHSHPERGTAEQNLPFTEETGLQGPKTMSFSRLQAGLARTLVNKKAVDNQISALVIVVWFHAAACQLTCRLDTIHEYSTGLVSTLHGCQSSCLPDDGWSLLVDNKQPLLV